MYVLQCSQGRMHISILKSFSDFVKDLKRALLTILILLPIMLMTGKVSCFKPELFLYIFLKLETFNCEDTPEKSIFEETTYPSRYFSQIFGNQYQRRLDCVSTKYDYTVHKLVSFLLVAPPLITAAGER